MQATRHSSSALLKSRIDFVDSRLKELEASASNLRAELNRLNTLTTLVSDAGPPPTPKPPPAPPKPLLKKQIIPPPLAPKIKVISGEGTVRPTKFTDAVCEQIKTWIEDGKTREEIAGYIGCTVGSLQVSCSKRGISLWPKSRPRLQQVIVVNRREVDEEATGT